MPKNKLFAFVRDRTPDCYTAVNTVRHGRPPINQQHKIIYIRLNKMADLLDTLQIIQTQVQTNFYERK